MLHQCVLILLALLSSSAQAQWVNYPAPGTPRTADGKPDLFAKAPRASNGKPDLSGVWQTEYAPPGENRRLFGNFVNFAVPGDDPGTFSKYVMDILADFKPEESPMRPEAAELLRKNAEKTRNGETPSARCLPHGLPRTDLFNYAPFKMIQTPGVIAVLYMRPTIPTARYTRMAASFPWILNQPGAATRSAGGKATRWSWTRQDLTTRTGSTLRATPIARICTFRSASTAATSATWI
jgi:hypothetical protein